MTNPPRPETRISELEAKMAIQDARIRELAEDTAEEFKALRQDNKELFAHVQKGFDQAHAYMKENIETRLDAMATKDDISRLENEMAAMKAEINQGIADLKTGLLEALRDLKQQ